jgi:ATP-binding cassette subfamily B (MDR/TAP) protein 1
MQMSRQHISDGGSLAEEAISTIRTAQAFGIQMILANIYNTHIDKSKKADDKIAVVIGASLATFFFILYSSYSLSFSFGTTLINEGYATPGEIVNVFMSILIGSISMAQFTPDMQAITQGRGAAAKLYQTIDRIPDIDSLDPGGLKPQNVKGHITFENVNFNYPSRPNVAVIENLSISFPAGKTVALVGASGSGKSTVVALVERFYDPLSGVVKLDGIDLKDLNIKWLRSHIGLVSQEPTLFATTIKGNVAHGLVGTEHEHANEEEKFALIKDACVKANADGFINSMPMGYDTIVGERGFLMSGGQKQRIAIARAIVSDPTVLLLDEATSALDTQSEGIVQNALDKAAAGKLMHLLPHWVLLPCIQTRPDDNHHRSSPFYNQGRQLYLCHGGWPHPPARYP